MEDRTRDALIALPTDGEHNGKLQQKASELQSVTRTVDGTREKTVEMVSALEQMCDSTH